MVWVTGVAQMVVWKLSVAVQLGSGFQTSEEEFEELCTCILLSWY